MSDTKKINVQLLVINTTDPKEDISRTEKDKNNKGDRICTEILGTHPEEESGTKANVGTKNPEEKNWMTVLHIAYNHRQNNQSSENKVKTSDNNGLE